MNKCKISMVYARLSRWFMCDYQVIYSSGTERFYSAYEDLPETVKDFMQNSAMEQTDNGAILWAREEKK